MDDIHQHPAIQIFQLKLLRRKRAVTPSQAVTASVTAAAAARPAPASAEAAETTAHVHSGAVSPTAAGTPAVAETVSSAPQQGLEAQSQQVYSEAGAALLPCASAAGRLQASLQAPGACHPDEEACRPASDAMKVQPVTSGIFATK